MARILIIVAVIVLVMMWWRSVRVRPEAERRGYILKSVALALAGVMIVLAAAGRLHWVVAAVGAVVAFIPRLLGLLKYIPLIDRLAKGYRGNQQQQQGGNAPGSAKGAMSRDEALSVLGLKDGATRQDVVDTHRRLMQKVHPDRGGSDYMAAQLNKAKETLLG